MSAAIESYEPVLSTWSDGTLRSPVSGAPLRRDTPFSLAAAGERWPVVEGIPYLRVGRRDLIDQALGALDAGEIERATCLLLADRAGGPIVAWPEESELVAVVRAPHSTSFREAMRRLALGDASETFAHHWSDPIFLSQLALAEAYWQLHPRLVDVGCGAGHFLHAAGRHAASVVGCDLVFAHLWLARHWVAPSADLVCFDAAHPWPLADASADMVLCHDSLHLFSDTRVAHDELRRVAGPGGSILCGHVRNGAAFGPSVAFDNAELIAALIGRRVPRPADPIRLAQAQTLAFAGGRAAQTAARPVLGQLAIPPRGTPLRRNPLYCEEPDGTCVRRFPSPRYAAEIGIRATYPAHVTARTRIVAGADPADDALIRRRVWVDLPAGW